MLSLIDALHAGLYRKFSLPVERRYIIMNFMVCKLNNIELKIAVDIYLYGNKHGKRIYELFHGKIEYWDVSEVTDMSYLFFHAPSFNKPLRAWNVSKVTNMSYMFFHSTFNQPIGNWNVSNVTNMAKMFCFSDFNQPINSWNVSNVRNMYNMFEHTRYFNQALDRWDVSNVQYMERMFCNAVCFNQPIGNWNVAKVFNMSFMFFNAIEFNQSLNTWKFPGNKNVQCMIGGVNSGFNQVLTGEWKQHQDLFMIRIEKKRNLKKEMESYFFILFLIWVFYACWVTLILFDANDNDVVQYIKNIFFWLYILLSFVLLCYTSYIINHHPPL